MPKGGEKMQDKRIRMDIPELGRIIGEYKILKEIGRGGFSISYLAKQESDGMLYIIKELYPIYSYNNYLRTDEGLLIEKDVARQQLKDSLNKAVEHEIAISNMINHDIGEELGVDNTNSPYIFRSEKMDTNELRTDVPYIIIATTSGNTLKQEVEKDISLPDAVNIIRKIYKAVTYGLHNKNIVHGDLKFSNVYVTGDSVRLIDFGSAYVMKKYTKELLLSNNGFSFSEVFASPRTKKLFEELTEIKECMNEGASHDYVEKKLTQACFNANKLSAYEDLYALFVMLFYMMFGCYPFYESLESLDDMNAFIKFQDVTAIAKRLLWVMTKAFYDENVQFVEENYEEWINAMEEAVTPGKRLWGLSEEIASSRREFEGVRRYFEIRYSAAKEKYFIAGENNSYELKVKPTKVNSIECENLSKNIIGIKDNDKDKVKVITGKKGIGKTWYMKNLLCELYDKFIDDGILPIFYRELTESAYKNMEFFDKMSKWCKLFCFFENIDIHIKDLVDKCKDAYLLIEKSWFDGADKYYCFVNKIPVYGYHFRKYALKEDEEKYNLNRQDRVAVTDPFYENPYIALMIKKEYKSMGMVVTTSKRLLLEKNIDFKMTKYKDTKVYLDDQAVKYAGQILQKDLIYESRYEYCKPLIDCNMMELVKKHSDGWIIQFAEGYYRAYYMARALMEVARKYNLIYQAYRYRNYDNRELEMLACFIDENDDITLEDMCKFIFGDDNTTEYAFNFVNLYRYSKAKGPITIKNVDFRGVRDLEYNLCNIDKKIIFENCIFSRECFSSDNVVVYNNSEKKMKALKEYEIAYYGEDDKDSVVPPYRKKHIMPEFYNDMILEITSVSILKKHMIEVFTYSKDVYDNIKEPQLSIMRICNRRNHMLSQGTIIDYSINDKLYCLVDEDGHNKYTTLDVDSNKLEVCDPVPQVVGLKPIRIEAGDGIILIGYGDEVHYKYCMNSGVPKKYNVLCQIKEIKYKSLNGVDCNWNTLELTTPAKNIMLMNNSLFYGVVICNNDRLEFATFIHDRFKVISTYYVGEYDYAICDKMTTVVLGKNGGTQINALHCQDIFHIAEETYELGVIYNPYSINWVRGSKTEICVVATYDKDTQIHIINLDRNVQVVRHKSIPRKNVGNWYMHEYRNCTCYKNVMSDEIDYTFYNNIKH